MKITFFFNGLAQDMVNVAGDPQHHGRFHFPDDRDVAFGAHDLAPAGAQGQPCEDRAPKTTCQNARCGAYGKVLTMLSRGLIRKTSSMRPPETQRFRIS